MIDEKTLLKRVYKYLSIRDRSEQEIRDYLLKKRAKESQVNSIITSLKQQGFIDDQNFLDLYINSYKNKSNGPKKIYFNLLKKGFSKEVIQNRLDKINDEDWQDAAKKYISKKASSIDKYEGYKKSQKIYRLLAQRGYELNTIKTIIDAYPHLE